jgi:hypothetical protein
MKAHSSIIRALLLILLLSPVGLRAFGSRISMPSCRVAAHAPNTHRPNQVAKSSLRAVLTASAHRSPAQRIHRPRGKKINIDPALVPAFTTSAIAPKISSTNGLGMQELNGPNPPRGPPLLSL